MRINTNIASLNAQRQMSQTARALSRALERLSSGRRINSGRDDASGLAIANRLEAQRRSLGQTIRNINDTKGWIGTAESVLGTQMEIVQRMRELAIQAANETVPVSDRRMLDEELQTLYAEFNRVTSQANFNGVNLLDGSFATLQIQVGTEKGQTIDFEMPDSLAENIFQKEVNAGTFSSSATLEVSSQNVNQVELEDLNNDGFDDLISVTNDKLVVSLGRGDGSFDAETSLSLTNTASNQFGAASFGDLDGDGDIDMAIASSSSSFDLYKNNGEGQFSFQKSLSAFGYTSTGVSIGDVNGDGKADIVGSAINFGEELNLITYQNLENDFNFINTASSTITPDLGGAGIGTISSPVLADLNQDGALDVTLSVQADIIGNNNAIEVFLGDNSGQFNSQQEIAVSGTVWTAPAIADFNGDGDLDLAYGVDRFAAFDLLIYRSGDGTGSFGSGATYTMQVSANPFQLRGEDLNNDGKADLVAILAASQQLLKFTSSTTTPFNSVKAFTEVSSLGFAFGDINDDGLTDIATRSNGVGVARLFFGDGTKVSAADEISIASVSDARNMLSILDRALDNLVERRAQLGALESRLDSAASGNSIMEENIAGARSQLLDADIASETAELARLQILQQAQASVLGQANTSLQIVLQLLGGLR